MKACLPRRRLKLLVWLLAALTVLPSTGGSAAAEVLFDLKPEFSPGPSPKALGFFRDQHLTAGSACTLEYSQNGTQLSTAWKVLEQPALIRNLFRRSEASIITWWSNTPLCSPETKISGEAGALKVEAVGPTAVAQSLSLLPDRIVMRQNSFQHFQKMYGSPFFRAEARLPRGGYNMTNFYLLLRRPPRDRIALGDYSSLRLTIDAKLDAADVLTGCVSGSAPEGAMNCYQRNKNATQFRVAFGNLIWRDPRCRGKDPGDPVCKFQGQYMQASLSLFDERFEFHNEDFFNQRGSALNARARIPIFRIDLHRFLPKDAQKNPFHVVGNRVRVTGDLLAAFRSGLLKAEREGLLPPRLTQADGRAETDLEYVAHYSFASVNIGYEVSGLSDMTYSVYGLKLEGTRLR